MKLTPDVEKLINGAIQFAVDERHEYVSLEHVCLGMCDDKLTAEIIEACGGDIPKLRRQLHDFLEKHCPKLPEKKGQDKALIAPGKASTDAGPTFTIAFHRVVQRAILQVQSSDREEVTTASLLISLLKEEESPSVVFMGQQGINRLDVIHYVSHGVTSEHPENELLEDGAEEAAPESPEAPKTRTKTKGSPLKLYCLNLNERALDGLIDPLIGRETEIERCVQILARRTKNNVLLVGDPGVGKTAIIDGLALRIVQGKVPAKLRDSIIYSLDMGSLVAGTKFRGDFENRMKSVIKAIEAQPGALLFIDEIHQLVGAGAVSGGSMDASNLLKPALVNRTVTCIGSTTYKEYRSYFEKDQALVRRFQKIDIKPPSVDEAVAILEGLRSRYEEFHKVAFSPEAIKAAVELSHRYIQGRPLPDKAIDVMDEAGARLRLKTEGEITPTVTEQDVELVVSSIAQVPSRTVSSTDKSRLKNLEAELKESIFGQDKAIEKVVSAIKLARSGLGSPTKPMGVFLFTGPTGVGKTELSRQVAKSLGTELIRFDMSEYMEKHTVSRLVGAPPGYVGYDEGGHLTEAVMKNPYGVLLLDEMEKAHPDIANILLQVMDSGKLTDTNGKTADFRNVILIMTSNAGARELSKQAIGIRPSSTEDRALNAVKNLFAPEFINRLDAIIPFEHLPEPVVLQIIKKFLQELSDQLAQKGAELEVTPAAQQWIYEKGYDRTYGARPLSRTIDEHVKKRLVDSLLFGELTGGGKILVDVADKELTFTFLPKV